ncbi:alpha/beta fold hydrolase [Nesterenkonia lutea]|uniref:Pimeloyl-ACP methyl ester carboxylesterase n=1 Tax=Nesterenkonia lutea TaxID=272919 RepID=A0ABR9JBM5_9MICC|nr:alpha/beta hydrolase [Nesterenkonia lutea]MBE1523325.1 pimeloyl-ACP methyl ester carboxylesterase [Nesterenkonia lutea]
MTENPAVPAKAGAAENAVTLNIDDHGGEGRPVVLIHGWPLTAESWSAQIDTLIAAGFRVITYDRRGFGGSAAPGSGYDYDSFADDLERVLDDLDLEDATLVGFSMGGGEVARYAARHGVQRLHSVVFASAVPPCLMQSAQNPDGPLDAETFEQMREGLQQDPEGFYEQFTTDFLSAQGELAVSDGQREEVLALARQADHTAALGSMDAWAHTDFRADLDAVTVPALIIHGDSDAVVPFEGSGRRTHDALPGSELVVIEGAPHGVNISHSDDFNRGLIEFLVR